MSEGSAYAAGFLWAMRNRLFPNQPGKNMLDGGAPFYRFNSNHKRYDHFKLKILDVIKQKTTAGWRSVRSSHNFTRILFQGTDHIFDDFTKFNFLNL